MTDRYPDPVHQHSDGTWFFFVETWANETGPFPSKEAAEEALIRYCRDELQHERYKGRPDKMVTQDLWYWRHNYEA